MHPASVGFQCPDDVRAGNEGVRQARGTSALATARRQWGPVTLGLIAVNVAVFGVTAVAATAQGASPLENEQSSIFADLVQVPLLVDRGDWWRPLTAAFLHYGAIHLAGNMLALLLFGSEVERLLGRARYLAVYAAGVLGGAAAIQLFGAYGGAVAGASTAIWGLLGAFAVVLVQQKQDLRGLLTLLGINLFISFLPGVSLIGHLGGLVGGGAAAALLVLLRRSRTASLVAGGVLAVLLLALVYA